ncbi:DUF3152 domain-containing protein [Micromonospora sp. NPDC047548]|uniref:DUF3152 domain-containing protein n=1 Tax=Micromonospora sp. NPDC047548 TaxID=3155624 RepID=UPI0033F1714D
MQRRVIGMGVLAAVLTAAAVLAWVDVLTDDRRAPVAAAVAQVRYAPPKVEVADDVTDIDPAEVAAVVDQAVNDPRGWRTNMDGFTVRIVQPGYRGVNGIGQLVGAAWADEQLAVVTADAWMRVGPRFAAVGGTLDMQRAHIVLHELGHLIGHDHESCPAPGQPAPLMRTATYALDGCTLNIWPNP